MKKPPKAPNVAHLPDECCGRCKFAHGDPGELGCVAMPPRLIIDNGGDYVSVRAAPVDAEDAPCIFFARRVS